MRSRFAPFQRRVYEIEELAEIFENVGLNLADVFDEDGRPWSPGDVEQEIYVEARLAQSRRKPSGLSSGG